MRGRWLWLGAVIVVWAGVAIWSSWPVTASGYEQRTVAAAQEASSAIGTSLIVVDAQSAGRLLSPYTATILAEQREAAATAVQELLTVEVPDEQSAGLRAEVGPLLVAASDGITAADAAVTDGQGEAIGAAADALTSVQQSLDEFVTDHQ